MTDAAAETAPCIQAQSILMEGDYQSEAQALIRSACSECKRRKQKCLRYWPCHHCGTRRVGNQCIFRTVLDVQSLEDRKAQIDQYLSRMKGKCCLSHPLGKEADGGSDNTGEDLQQFGYGTTLDQEKEPKYTVQHLMSPADFPGLQIALQAFPSRQCLDALVDNYLNKVNFHYYIVHPTVFRQEYNQWRDDREHEKPLGVQWTTLLLMACACSAQRPDAAIHQALQIDQGPPAPELANRLHNAGHELYMATPKSALHIHTLQQLLQSVLWLKTRVRFYDCLDVLKSAILVAYGLGVQLEATSRAISSDFDREMGRRAWVIVNVLDWQMAAIFSRSRSLALSQYDIELPNFQLSEELKESSRSPIVSMALQCGLADSLLEQFGQLRSLDVIDEVEKYEVVAMPNQGMLRLSPHFVLGDLDERLDDLDEGLDARRQCHDLQRFIASIMRLSATLAPLRPYLIKPLSRASPAVELRFRLEGLLWALRYIDKLFGLLRYIFPTHRKYPIVVFLIFDAATLLCSAIIHDSDSSMLMGDSSMLMGDPSWAAVQGSVDMLRHLRGHSPIAKRAYEILDPIYNEMLGPPADDDEMPPRKRRRLMPTGDATPRVESFYTYPASLIREKYDFTFEMPSNVDTNSFDMASLPPTDIRVLRAQLARLEDVQTAAALHLVIFETQDIIGGTGIPDVLSSTEIPAVDDIPTQANASTQSVQEIPVTMPDSVKSSGDATAPEESNHIPETEHSSPDSGLGVLEGLWDYDRVNLGLYRRTKKIDSIHG